MPCCGEPKKGKKDFSNRPTPQQTGPVVIQPGLHPPPQFQPPNVTPPPIHASGFPQNGFGIHSQPPWTHSPPPPPANDLGAQHGLLTGSTNLPASTYNGSTFNVNGSPGQPSIARPLSAQRTQSPPLGGLPPGASPPTVPAPRDEGRMSVAIDFGKSHPRNCILPFVTDHRYNIFRHCESYFPEYGANSRLTSYSVGIWVFSHCWWCGSADSDLARVK